jgi:ATP-dependent protease ClpP protease subunit
MTIRTLPEIKALQVKGLSFEPEEAALARWDAGVRAAAEGDDNVISIYDVIGEDFWTGEGMTSKRVAGALRRIGARDVTVNINSPGGDFFEGTAIYELLRQHSNRVTVKVVGLAASAASVIAMAGDEIQISEVGFIMVHNAWAVALGNRHDLRQAADTLEPFDTAMAGLYGARSGVDKDEAADWMDAETWFNGQGAVQAGLADVIMAPGEIDQSAEAPKNLAAVRRIESALACQGMSRSERRSLIAEITGRQAVAAEPSSAVASDAAPSLRALMETIRSATPRV